MKHLFNYINESLFDNDLVTKAASINGEIVVPDVWKKCEKSFDWFRKTIVNNQGSILVDVGTSPGEKYDIIYNEKDCVLMIDAKKRLTIMSPETIWFNYVKGSLREIPTSGNKLPTAPRIAFYCMTFAKKPFPHSDYYTLEYKYHHESVCGYTPITISDKAKKIIEK